MATQHPNSALRAQALSAAYPMAKPGYGKRSAPDQRPRTRHDFALLPTRERYVAGFVDHLPEGAAMSVKHLAKQLPLYGQQAIGTALTALSVAGHLRRVRCVVGVGDETRWVFRTFWSRTPRDNEWWNAYLAAENASRPTGPAPDASASATAPRPPWADSAEEPPPVPPLNPRPQQTPAALAVPGPPPLSRQLLPVQRPNVAATVDTHATPAAPHSSDTAHSPAYIALARLGRDDHRLALSAADCAALEAQAAQWLARGVTVDYLTSALTAGIPARIDSPVGFLRRRLIDKMPPRLPTETAPPNSPAPARRVLVECTDCGRPGPPQALPDGLCRPCHTAHAGTDRNPPHPAEVANVKAHMTNLRGLLKSV